MLELVFTRRYSMGHRLIHGANGICATPHGHNEEVTVYLRSLDPQPLDGGENVVIPFYYAKLMWHRFIDRSVDHAFQLAENDPIIHWFVEHEPARVPHLMITPGDPTTELMACLYMVKVNSFLTSENIGLKCDKISIKETPTNTVTFTGDPLPFIPCKRPPEKCWWHRADMSISDFDQ
ncbi:hypothetical protein COMNV_00540 [Commensalibacter sp. Nvir]|uniref:6-pyruvoyl trahydropterin synthase family protein n=1 Tax=Commensalibacter sp. Nvir TaxID=3069817 RepID=UPI002D6A2E2D|nr:hypothetical protein COMNV_00540 [Commensalibacter sp. Nvir]